MRNRSETFDDHIGAGGTASAFTATPQPAHLSTVAPAPSAVDGEVTFISGISSTGAVAPVSYNAWNTDTNPADYSGNYSNVTKWNASGAGESAPGTAGGTVKFYFDPGSNWTATEKADLQAGLALWSAEANVSFLETTTPSQANFTFKRGTDGGAATNFGVNNLAQYGDTTIPEESKVTISIDTKVGGFGPINGSFSQYGGYAWTTLIHEEGHMLGLGHAGPYNGDDDPKTQQFSAYDNWQYSIMSYIQPDDTTAKYFSSYATPGTHWGSSGGYEYSPTTPMILDVAAIQRLYGAPTSTPLSGGQTFGFHDNISGPVAQFFDFTKNTHPVVTLFDTGTGNTLDLSGFSVASTVNLNAGAFSSVNGATNDIGIAYGTRIDTAIGGSGPDRITANGDGDKLLGGAGNDTLVGGSGADTLTGGAGNDVLTGGGGADHFVFVAGGGADVITDFAPGQDQLDLSAVGIGSLSAALSHATQVGASTVIAFGDGGQVTLQNVSLASLSSGAFPGVSAAPSAVHDVNADGRADVIAYDSSGALQAWVSGASPGSASVQPLGDLPAGAQVLLQGQPAQDYNGDGRADLLVQLSSGHYGLLLSATGTGFTTDDLGAGIAGMAPVAAADLNGDGKADILWRNPSTGDVAAWLSGAGSGAPSYTTQSLGGAGANWSLLAAADLNGDGRADVLWRDGAGDLSLWQSTGSSVGFTRPSLGVQPLDWQLMFTGDVNGDGKQDLLWESTSTHQLQLWTSGAAGSYAQSNIGAASGGWGVVEVNDFTADGKADILWRDGAGHTVLWAATGNGTFNAHYDGPLISTDWHIV